MQAVCIEECVCRQHGIGGNDTRRTADTAGELDALVGDFGLIAALLLIPLAKVACGRFCGGVGMTVAVDLALGVEIVDDKEDDVENLGVGEILFVAVQSREIRYAVLLQHVEQLQLGACQLGLDAVHLTRDADVDVRVGAGEHEEVIREEQGGIDRIGMRLAANEAGNGQADGAVAVVDDLQLALAAGAFQLDHVGREIEEADGRENAAAAIGTAVGNSGTLFVE